MHQLQQCASPPACTMKRPLNNKIIILRLYSADFRYFCGPKTESVLGNHLELARNSRKESPASP